MYHKYMGPPKQDVKAREDQVKNNAGGYVFSADKFDLLKRFLILGTEGGTYYSNERQLTISSLQNTKTLLDKDPNAVLEITKEYSNTGRIPKNDTAIAVLAIALSHDDVEVRRLAAECVGTICRIPTHIFTLLNYLKKSEIRGFGRLIRKTVSKWYTNKEIDTLVYHLLKYQSRNGWSHKDVFRTIHVKPTNEFMEQLFGWILEKKDPPNHQLINDFIKLRDENTTSKDVINIIKNNKSITWEFIPTRFLKEKEVWEQLLPNLPYMALIRNLGRMSSIGVITPLSDNSKFIQKRILDFEQMTRQRVHPVALYLAYKTYSNGRSDRGSLKWDVDADISNALEEAFNASFKSVKPTGKNYLIGIDVSGSMDWNITNGITAAEGAAVLALTFKKVEENVHCMAFSHELIDFPIGKNWSIKRILSEMEKLEFGATDCSLPILYAIEKHIDNVDAFITLTDSETWYGYIHPYQALQKYRKKIQKNNVKSMVVAMQTNDFTIADPEDPYMADFVGFDPVLPKAIQEFSKI